MRWLSASVKKAKRMRLSLAGVFSRQSHYANWHPPRHLANDNRQLSCAIDGVGLSAHYDGGRKPDIHRGLEFCIRWQAASHSISC
jgi:hypothetical protein